MHYEDLPRYSRYEVRKVNLEELYMMGYEEAMTYIPCRSLREAVEEYKKMVEAYNDCNHEVALMAVTYGMNGYEKTITLASTRHDDPMAISIPMEDLE